MAGQRAEPAGQQTAHTDPGSQELAPDRTRSLNCVCTLCARKEEHDMQDSSKELGTENAVTKIQNSVGGFHSRADSTQL